MPHNEVIPSCVCRPAACKSAIPSSVRLGDLHPFSIVLDHWPGFLSHESRKLFSRPLDASEPIRQHAHRFGNTGEEHPSDGGRAV